MVNDFNDQHAWLVIKGADAVEILVVAVRYELRRVGDGDGDGHGDGDGDGGMPSYYEDDADDGLLCHPHQSPRLSPSLSRSFSFHSIGVALAAPSSAPDRFNCFSASFSLRSCIR